MARSITMSEFQQTVRTIVKEEVARVRSVIKESADFFGPVRLKNGKLELILPRDGAVRLPPEPGKKLGKIDMNATMRKGYEDFANWILAPQRVAGSTVAGSSAPSGFGHRLPEDVKEQAKNDPMVVLDYLNNNPDALPLSPKQLRDIWKQMPSLKKGIGKLSAKDLGNLDAHLNGDNAEDPDGIPDFATAAKLSQDIRAGHKASTQKRADGKEVTRDVPTTYNKGDVSLKDIGAEIGGVTPAMVNYIIAGTEKKMEPYKKEPISPEKWENAITDAADGYVQLLQAANGDLESFYSALVAAGVVNKDELGVIRPYEEATVRYLSDLAVKGNVSQAEEFLINDLEESTEEYRVDYAGDMDMNPSLVQNDRGQAMNPEQNRVKSFQNLFSKIFHNTKGRGRSSDKPFDLLSYHNK